MDSHTKKNYRPSNQVLESLQLSTHVSTNEGLWTQEDDVRLIRAYECFNSASWVDIVKLFPNRHKHSVKTRYRDHLERQTGDLAISVPPELMFGCIPPTKQSSNAQNAIRSEDTMVPALLVSGQPSNDPARPEVFVNTSKAVAKNSSKFIFDILEMEIPSCLSFNGLLSRTSRPIPTFPSQIMLE
jgi:hypothetical protein